MYVSSFFHPSLLWRLFPLITSRSCDGNAELRKSANDDVALCGSRLDERFLKKQEGRLPDVPQNATPIIRFEMSA
jgi:hypothetical protein